MQIKDYTEKTTLSGTEELILQNESGGITQKTTINAILNLALASFQYPIGTILEVRRESARPGNMGYAGTWADVTSDWADRVPRAAGSLAGTAFTTQEDAFQEWQLGADHDASGARDYWGYSGDRDSSNGQVNGWTYFSALFMNTECRGCPRRLKAMPLTNSNPIRVADETRVKSFIVEYWERIS